MVADYRTACSICKRFNSTSLAWPNLYFLQGAYRLQYKRPVIWSRETITAPLMALVACSNVGDIHTLRGKLYNYLEGLPIPARP